MGKIFKASAFLAGVILLGIVVNFIQVRKNSSILRETGPTQSLEDNFQDREEPAQRNSSNFETPVERAGERISKKPFGIYITRENSPVSPERFSGYHTGTDFEIFPEEMNQEVSVKAICAGKLRVKEYADGYGGVAVEECELDGVSMTVVYGHLNLSSIILKLGDDVLAGEKLGILGEDKSFETDGERKHLHLGIHKGSAINIRGYVSSKSQLSNWIDPCLLVCEK
ncbi:MAG: M23 family metallopeptidase [Patescibacteria group bacterium]